MTAEFDWWLLILGLVVGAAIVWLVLAELPRRDSELDAAEMDLEAGWIAANLGARNRPMDPSAVRAVLDQHRAYLRLPPPDEPAPGAVPDGTPTAAPTQAPPGQTPSEEAPPETQVARPAP